MASPSGDQAWKWLGVAGNTRVGSPPDRSRKSDPSAVKASVRPSGEIP
jgi:hypothetical protein